MKLHKIEKAVKVFLILIVGVFLGYGLRMYVMSQHPTKPGILIQPTDKVKWSISEVRQSYSATARQQKYIAHDEAGDVVLLIKSPPMDVWVGDWK